MNTDNHINYSASEIQRYLSGKMTPLEMNKLEKAALEDAFLADAIEGYESVQQENWNEHLIEIKKSFSQKNLAFEPAKVVPITPKNNNWKKAIAAVFAIVLGCVLVYQLTKKDVVNNNTQELAKNENIEPLDTNSINTAANGTVETIVAKTDSNKKNIVPQTPVLEKLKSNTYIVTSGLNVASGETNTTPTAEHQGNLIAAKDAEKALDESKQLKEVVVLADKTNNLENDIKKPTTTWKSDAAAPVTTNNVGFANNRVVYNNFSASVVSADGNPLPFANVNIKNEGIGTYADNRGAFRLISQDTTLTVEIKSIGYDPIVYKLNSSTAQNKIVLREANNSDDYYKKERDNFAKRKAEIKPQALIRTPKLVKDSTIFNVEPADGWDNYNTYVANNLDLDDIKSNNKSLQGEVEISFDVQENGAITNITADGKNCNNCEEAAKKLVQQGPQWKVKNGKLGRAKIKVKF